MRVLCLCLLLAARSASGQANPSSNQTAVDAPESRDAEDAARSGPSAMSELSRGYKKMAQTILPLLVGFKATGLLVIAIAVTKAILLKALFLSTTALAVAALVALKKFLSSAMQHHGSAAYTYQHHDLSHVPYLHPEYIASETQLVQPQVTYLGGSYGLHTMPYAAAGAGAGLGAADDVQGLYSSHSVVPAVLPAAAGTAQLQQLQERHQALLAQHLQLHHLQQLANHTQEPRRRLSGNHTKEQLSRLQE